MKPKSGGMLLGFKAICLSSSLKDSQRSVGAAILDHYNHKTGQCDPSLDTIAFLVGLSRRTVIRCVNALVRAGLFRRIRHGGNFHRNFYEPVWTFFEQAEVNWKRLRKENKTRRRATQELSHSQGQPCRIADDKPDTQTFQINISKGTSPDAVAQIDRRSIGQLNVRIQPRSSEFKPKQISSGAAAHDAAERRWNRALQEQYLREPAAYASIVELIDAQLQAAATEAELKTPGSGLPYIIEQLRSRRNDSPDNKGTQR